MTIKDVKKVYNEYIRIKKSNKDGFCQCVCCGKIMFWKGSGDCQCGHYEHGLDFIEDNMHPQCKRCNYYDSDAKHNYHDYMIKTYGEQRVLELKGLKKMSLRVQYKHSQFELKEKKKYYRKLIREELKKRGLK